jgi:hypothetical protein
MVAKVLAVIVLANLGGCASPGVRLTVTSSPDGAYITSGNGAVSGIVPVTAFYAKQSLKPDDKGCFQLQGFTARWASGAVTDVPVLQHCAEPDGNYSFNMMRNMNAPDFDKDLQFALQVQNLRAQTAQAEASQAAALAALWSASTVSQKAYTPVQCSSYTIGNTIQTTCR